MKWRDHFDWQQTIEAVEPGKHLRTRYDALTALANKRLPTFAAETEVRFASPEARTAFAKELTESIAALVAECHEANAENGRSYRMPLGACPRPPSPSAVS